MKLPADAVIAESRLTRYLLQPRTEDDKSKFLAIGGYLLENWPRLDQDIRGILVHEEAELVEVTGYGEVYHLPGRLAGPSGLSLDVVTV